MNKKVSYTELKEMNKTNPLIDKVASIIDCKFITKPVGSIDNNVFITKTFDFDSFEDLLEFLKDYKNEIIIYSIFFKTLKIEYHEDGTSSETLSNKKCALRLCHFTGEVISDEILPEFNDDIKI